MLHERCKQLIRMLASPVDGEVLTAARKLAIALKVDGHDFHDLADGKPWGAKSYAPPPPPPRERSARETLAELLKLNPVRMRPREREFLERLTSWDGAFTEKQAAWLRRLEETYLGRRAA